jgi:hypothetical protein
MTAPAQAWECCREGLFPGFPRVPEGGAQEFGGRDGAASRFSALQFPPHRLHQQYYGTSSSSPQDFAVTESASSKMGSQAFCARQGVVSSSAPTCTFRLGLREFACHFSRRSQHLHLSRYSRHYLPAQHIIRESAARSPARREICLWFPMVVGANRCVDPRYLFRGLS